MQARGQAPLASPTVQPRYVEGAGGVPIATWELTRPDQPQRPALLVAHATGFHARCYRSLATGLAERFRVVGFDCRGHGHSGTPPLDADEEGRIPAMAWERFADDALTVVDALHLEGATAFGHSCGATVLLLAEQRRPGSFAGIFAYEAVAGPPELWAHFAGLGHDPSPAASRRRAVFPSRAAALAHYEAKPPLSSLRPDVLASYVEDGFVDQPDGTVRLRCDPGAEAATFSMGPHAAVWDHLDAVACPTTFACGGGASDFGSKAATALAARVPAGRVEEFAFLGHLGPLQAPDEVALSIAASFPSDGQGVQSWPGGSDEEPPLSPPEG